MVDTSFEERARCFHCKEPGRPIKSESERDGRKHFTYTCETVSCCWYHTNWTFDIMPDGSLYVPKPRAKSFPAIPDRTSQMQELADQELRRSMGY